MKTLTKWLTKWLIMPGALALAPCTDADAGPFRWLRNRRGGCGQRERTVHVFRHRTFGGGGCANCGN